MAEDSGQPVVPVTTAKKKSKAFVEVKLPKAAKKALKKALKRLDIFGVLD